MPAGSSDGQYFAERAMLISAPDGEFDSCYNTVFEPEEIFAEIEKMKLAHLPGIELRERLYSYRFYTRKEMGKEIVSDRFLTFWVELLYYDKTVDKSKFRLKLARNSLKSRLINKKLSSVFDGDWPNERVLYEQLYSAARRYLITCQTDRNYTSHVFGFISIKRPQLIEKIVADFFDAAICFAWRCGLLAEFPVVGKAALGAWSDEFPEMEHVVWSRIEKNVGHEATEGIIELLSV